MIKDFINYIKPDSNIFDKEPKYIYNNIKNKFDGEISINFSPKVPETFIVNRRKYMDSNTESDYHKYLDLCRGLIFRLTETSDIDMICWNFPQYFNVESQPTKKYIKYTPIIDGTIIRLYYNPDTLGWCLATNRHLDAFNAKWEDSKRTFGSIFTKAIKKMNINFDKLTETLDKTNTYIFCLVDSNVSKFKSYPKESKVYLISTYSLKEHKEIFNNKIKGIPTIPVMDYSPESSENPGIDFIDDNINPIGYAYIAEDYTRNIIYDSKTQRIREYISNIPEKNTEFIALKAIKSGQYEDYIKLFPENELEAESIKDKYDKLINNIYKKYVAKFISNRKRHKSRKSPKITEIDSILMMTIHEYYFKHGIVIDQYSIKSIINSQVSTAIIAHALDIKLKK